MKIVTAVPKATQKPLAPVSKETRQELEKRLSNPWGSVELQCDSDRISLAVHQTKPLRYEIMTYVNGQFLGVWLDASKEAPEQRYLRKITKPNVSPASRKEAEKAFGKRRVANDKFWSGSYSYYAPYWPSPKAVIAHLCKVAATITIIDEERVDFDAGPGYSADLHHRGGRVVPRNIGTASTGSTPQEQG